MLKKFSTKQLIFLALMGALLFVTSFIVELGIDAATGIPGTGYLLNGFLFIMLAVVGALIVRKFWTITIMGVIYTALATPTILLGPPGFYKIFLGFIIGIIADIILLIFRYRNIGYYLSFTIGNLVTLPIWIGVLILLGIPGVEEIMSLIWISVGVYIVQGLVGAWLGIWFYGKIKNKTIIKQIKD